MRIAIVGGTGSFGRALAERIALLGESVVIGSRDAARAGEIATVLGVEGATNEEAVAQHTRAVEIDPELAFPDVDRSNNRWAKD